MSDWVRVEPDRHLGTVDHLPVHLEAPSAHRTERWIVRKDEPPLVAARSAGGELVTLDERHRRAAAGELVGTCRTDDASPDHDHVWHGCSGSASCRLAGRVVSCERAGTSVTGQDTANVESHSTREPRLHDPARGSSVSAWLTFGRVMRGLTTAYSSVTRSRARVLSTSCGSRTSPGTSTWSGSCVSCGPTSMRSFRSTADTPRSSRCR